MTKARHIAVKDGNGNRRPDEIFKVVKGVDMDPLLYDLLSHPTPHGHEKVLHSLMPPSATNNKKAGYIRHEDKKGNVWYFVGKLNKHRTMFSCHMDTVHRDNDFIVTPVKSENGFVYGSVLKTDPKTPDDKTLWNFPSVLGADDKIGMFIMLKMLEKRIPGVYAFHVGEEKGCVGSSWAVEQTATLQTIKNIDRCIAFDRRGYNNVITKQRGDTCCSKEFAEALAKQLNDNKRMPPMIGWFPDPSGMYTDSASYMWKIPECTNISVGYFNQHTENEHFDLEYLNNYLLPSILDIDWQALPTVRVPKKPERKVYNYGSYYGGNYGGNYDGEEWPNYVRNGAANSGGTDAKKNVSGVTKLNGLSVDAKWTQLPSLLLPELVAACEEDAVSFSQLLQLATKYMTNKSIEGVALDLVNLFRSRDSSKTLDKLKLELEVAQREAERYKWAASVAEDHSEWAWSQVGDVMTEADTLQTRLEALELELKEAKDTIATLSKNKRIISIRHSQK